VSLMNSLLEVAQARGRLQEQAARYEERIRWGEVSVGSLQTWGHREVAQARGRLQEQVSRCNKRIRCLRLAGVAYAGGGGALGLSARGVCG